MVTKRCLIYFSKHWVYNATAYNNSYGDSGLFCIYGSAPSEYMKKLTDVLIQELHGMASIPDQEEFEVKNRILAELLRLFHILDHTLDPNLHFLLL